MSKELEVIILPREGKHGFWCQGECGSGQICSDLTSSNGYCLDPKRRLKAIIEAKCEN